MVICYDTEFVVQGSIDADMDAQYLWLHAKDLQNIKPPKTPA